MALNAKQKSTIITENKLHEKDTGSSEVQIALISKRVTDLTEHFKTHYPVPPKPPETALKYKVKMYHNSIYIAGK